MVGTGSREMLCSEELLSLRRVCYSIVLIRAPGRKRKERKKFRESFLHFNICTLEQFLALIKFYAFVLCCQRITDKKQKVEVLSLQSLNKKLFRKDIFAVR